MLWMTLWFMVILKIPALWVAYVIWWAVKDPPAPAAAAATDGGLGESDHGPHLRRDGRRGPFPGRRPGPHGTPARRPARPAFARARARESA